jgi:uncharacterized protein (DUF2235 family)
MKRLILSNDGTWNAPDQEDNGVLAPTNVVKLHNALAGLGEGGVAQLAYYHPGVGAKSNLLETAAGGAVGAGISKHIRSAYHWLATHYETGDAIYLFGFSRGAFTARSLGGLLGRGLLDLRGVAPQEAWARVDAAYQAYQTYTTRDDDQRQWAEDWPFFHGTGTTPVRFLGVWDTVGALGVPDDLELLNLFDNADKWRFHDTRLGAHVRTARHAMAIDEIRASFTVTRWANAHEHADAKELWFPGVHGNVGGGYANTDLSDSALLWMMQEAQAAGLAFRPGVEGTLKPNPLGVLHNSYKGAFAKLRSRPRKLEAMVQANQALFHSSALARQAASPIAYPAYHPTTRLAPGQSHSLDVHADTQWNASGVYLAAGEKYRFSASGEWLDASDACDWHGTSDGHFTAGDIIRLGGTALGHIENLVKKASKNPSTDFWLTKRVEGYGWFTLVGAIANDSGMDAIVPNDGSPSPHEYLDLPAHEHDAFHVQNPGYLFCFANDVWSLYGNNHGSVRLTITRTE